MRPRHGRLLVECLVAMLLLNVSALVVVTLARSASRSTQAAQLTTASWAESTRGIESAVALRCGAGTQDGTDAPQSRIVVRWSERDQNGWRERDVGVDMQASALTGANALHLRTRAAWSCP